MRFFSLNRVYNFMRAAPFCAVASLVVTLGTVIALFYSDDLQPVWLLVALLPLGLFTVLVQRRVHAWWAIWATNGPGAALWASSAN